MQLSIMRYAALTATLTTCLVGAGTTANAQSGTTAKGSISTNDWADQFNKLKNVKSIGTKCGSSSIAAASGRGKMTLRIDKSTTRSTTTSKNIQATSDVISAGVGWDVTKAQTITVSGSKEVPRGKYGTLTAYTKYSGKKFDVYAPNSVKGDWRKVQSGKTAYKPIGVCFKYKQR